MRTVADSTNPSTNHSTNQARSTVEAARYSYRLALPFLERAWQDMVLERAADPMEPVPTAVAVARAEALRLRRRGELATEALDTIAAGPSPPTELVALDHMPTTRMASTNITTAVAPAQEPNTQMTTLAGSVTSPGLDTLAQQPTTETANTINTAAPVHESKMEKTALPGADSLGQQPTTKTASKFQTAEEPVQESKPEKTATARPPPASETLPPDQWPTADVPGKFKPAAPSQESETEKTSETTATRPVLSPRIDMPAQEPTTDMPTDFETAAAAWASRTETTTVARPATSSGTLTSPQKPTTKRPSKFKTGAAPAWVSRTEDAASGAAAARPASFHRIDTPAQEPTANMPSDFETAALAWASRTESTIAARPAASSGPFTLGQNPTTKWPSKFKTGAAPAWVSRAEEATSEAAAARPAISHQTHTPAQGPATNLQTHFETAAAAWASRTESTIAAWPATSSGAFTSAQNPTIQWPRKLKTAMAPARVSGAGATSGAAAARPAIFHRINTPVQEPTTNMPSDFETAALAWRSRTESAIAGWPAPPSGSLKPAPKPTKKMPSKFKTAAPRTKATTLDRLPPSYRIPRPSHRPTTTMSINSKPPAAPAWATRTDTAPETTGARATLPVGTLGPPQHSPTKTAGGFKASAPVRERKKKTARKVKAKTSERTVARLTLPPGTLGLPQTSPVEIASVWKTPASVREPTTETTSQTTVARLPLSPGTLAPTQTSPTKIASRLKTPASVREPTTERNPQTIAASPARSRTTDVIVRLPQKPTTTMAPENTVVSPVLGALRAAQKATGKMSRKFETAEAAARGSKAETSPSESSAARSAPSPGISRAAKKPKSVLPSTFKTAASAQEAKKAEKAPETTGTTTTTARPAPPSRTLTPAQRPMAIVAEKFRATPPVQEPKRNMTPETTTGGLSPLPRILRPARGSKAYMARKFPAAAPSQQLKTRAPREQTATNFRTAPSTREPRAEAAAVATAAGPELPPEVHTPTQKPEIKTVRNVTVTVEVDEPKTVKAPKKVATSPARSPGILTPARKPRRHMTFQTPEAAMNRPPLPPATVTATHEPTTPMATKIVAACPVPSLGIHSPAHEPNRNLTFQTPEATADRPTTPYIGAATPGEQKTKMIPDTTTVSYAPSPGMDTPARRLRRSISVRFNTAGPAEETASSLAREATANPSHTPETIAARSARPLEAGTPSRRRKPSFSRKLKTAPSIQELKTEMAPETAAASSTPPLGYATPTRKPRKTISSRFKTAAPAQKPEPQQAKDTTDNLPQTPKATTAANSAPSSGTSTTPARKRKGILSSKVKTAAAAQEPETKLILEAAAAGLAPPLGFATPARKRKTALSSSNSKTAAAAERPETKSDTPDKTAAGPALSSGFAMSANKQPKTKTASNFFKRAAPAQAPKTKKMTAEGAAASPAPAPAPRTLAQKLKKKLSRRFKPVTPAQEAKTSEPRVVIQVPDITAASPAVSRGTLRPAYLSMTETESEEKNEEAAQETKTDISLLNTEALLTSRNPIIRKVGHRFQRYVLEVDDDGNCYGTSWVLSVLLWAVQSPSRLKAFLGELEDASRDSGAFVDLNYAVKIHVTTFVGYVRELEEAWHGRDADDSAFGVSLAVGVVTTLLGPPEVSGAMDEKEALERPEEEGLDPQWLQLKWGVAVVSRAFDVWAAFEHGLPQEDVDKLRTLCQSVEFDIGREMAAADSSTAAEPGTTSAPPPKGVMRLGHVVNMVVLWPVSTGIKELNLNEALGVPPGATPERTVTGLSLLKGGLPHFDVEVSADTPLAEALCRTFDLPGVLGADPQALRQLQQQSDSQRETTKEELESLLSPAELVAQTTAFKRIYTVEEDRTMAAALIREEEQFERNRARPAMAYKARSYGIRAYEGREYEGYSTPKEDRTAVQTGAAAGGGYETPSKRAG